MVKIIVSAESCKSCGYCLKFCPKGVLDKGSDMNSRGYQFVVPRNMEECIGCAMCAQVCPEDAIEVYRLGGQDE